MASDQPAHILAPLQAGAHSGVEKSGPTDNVQLPATAHSDAYASLIQDLQNSPTLQSLLKPHRADAADPANAWATFILEHDHSRDVQPTKAPDNEVRTNPGR